MDKPVITLVFDRLLHRREGGLAAAGGTFRRLLSDEYDVKVVSIFPFEHNDVPGLEDADVQVVVDSPMDGSFAHIMRQLRNEGPGSVFKSLKGALTFFSSIPSARDRMRELVEGSIPVVTSPAAAIFMPEGVEFILDLHIAYEYFWEGGIVGRMQSMLMRKPTVTVFRTSTDAIKGSKRFPSDYVLNCVPDPVDLDEEVLIIPSSEGLSVPAHVPASEDAGRDTALSRANLQKGRALFMGRLAHQKDPTQLLSIMEAVLIKLPDFQLDIFGIGELEEELSHEIRSRGLQDNVTLKGFTDDKSVYDDYDMLWLTSRVEGLPLVILEAKSYGVPTITMDWGDGARETVHDGIDGFIFDDIETFAGAVTLLEEDSILLSEMKRAAREDYLERFTEPAWKERWLRILHRSTR